MNRLRKISARAALPVYIAAMLFLLLHRERAAESLPYPDLLELHLNLVPLRTIRLYLRLLSEGSASLRRIAAVNLAGNVLLFVPAGLLLPASFPAVRTLPRVLGVAAISLVILEALQALLLVGSCDVDDLLLNLVGAALGYAVYSFLRKKRIKAARPVNLAARKN